MKKIIRKLRKLFLILICIFITCLVFNVNDPKIERYRLDIADELSEMENSLKHEQIVDELYEADRDITENELQVANAAEKEYIETKFAYDYSDVAEKDVGGNNKLDLKVEAEIANDNILLKKLPGVAILGVKKCGTIALSQMLKMHPKMAAPANPEIFYWHLDNEFKKGLDYYKNLMPVIRTDQTLVVATPGILDIPGDTTFLRRLQDAIPDVKVLLVVKNPIDRVVSDILHEYSAAQHKHETMPDIDDILLGRAGHIEQRGLSGLSLPEMVFYLSNYSLIHQMVSQVFPWENILVVNGDKIVTEPLQEIRRVESFLELSPFYRDSHFFYQEGRKFPCFRFEERDLCMDPKHKGREHPVLKRETLDYLQNHFQSMVEKFSSQSGISFRKFMDKFGNQSEL